jgi:hypothetical protein
LYGTRRNNPATPITPTPVLNVTTWIIVGVIAISIVGFFLFLWFFFIKRIKTVDPFPELENAATPPHRLETAAYNDAIKKTLQISSAEQRLICYKYLLEKVELEMNSGAMNIEVYQIS